jgi:hypothetical protein
MEPLSQYLALAVSAIGLIGGVLSYLLGLKIKHDILQNNEALEKDIAQIREKLTTAVSSLRDELVREFGTHLTKLDTKLVDLERTHEDLIENLNDKILGTVNGKYVRTDLHQQSVANINERFTSLKELIEVNMDKIEQGLDRQILDLKERIFHSK